MEADSFKSSTVEIVCPECNGLGATDYDCMYCIDGKIMPMVEIKCDACGGAGYGDMLYGYVTHDMAMDGGDMALEGEEIWGEAPCPVCGGGGIVGIIEEDE